MTTSPGLPPDANEQMRRRREKLETWRARGVNPFGARFPVTHWAGTLQARFKDADEAGLQSAGAVALAGRVMAMRHHGKTCFAVLRDQSGQIQLYARADVLGDAYPAFVDLDVGDFIGVTGELFRTRTNELTVAVKQFEFLAKALRPLPEKWHGLKDVETRYRRRYVDLIVNPQVREAFVMKSRLIAAMRAFFDARGFLEVETPMMQPIPGGAAAKPFVTHHNALDMPLYQPYADYQDLMQLTEELFLHLGQTLRGRDELTYQGETIRLAPPWRRLPFFGGLGEAVGGPVTPETDARALGEAATRRGGFATDRKTQAVLRGEHGAIALWKEIFDTLVEPTLVQPTFVVDFPIELSPLSKQKQGQPRLVDRFELYVSRRELANAYSELNDPIDQRRRFEEQAAERERGDEEAHWMDEDFVRALEYGLPPTAGEGIGVDRLAMLFTDAASIRDVILFPHLRPERSSAEDSDAADEAGA